MVQHVFIVPGLDGSPTAQPHQVNVWRDDQKLEWKISMPLIGWDNEGPGGPGRAIVFDSDNRPQWEGSIPAPVGTIVGVLDQRLYTATGPGANRGVDSVNFGYTMYVVDAEGNHFHIKGDDTQEIPVDPEIGNQPQP